MKKLIIFILVSVFAYCLHADKYIHYYMNDGTFNGFYTSLKSEVENNIQTQTSVLSLNGNEYTIPLANIEKIVIEDAIVNENFNGDYRIYQGLFPEESFKHVIIDTRACLLASKNGDFGANDTILFSSYYNNQKFLILTNARGKIHKVFNGSSLYYYDYQDDVLDNVIELTTGGTYIEHPEMLESILLSATSSSIVKKACPPIPPEILNALGEFLVDLLPTASNFLFGEAIHNYNEVFNNPEMHNQMLILDGLSIAGDIAGIAGAFLAGIPTGGLAWTGVVVGVAALGNDFIGLMNDMFPERDQLEKFKEYYQNKYAIIIKANQPENVKCNRADLKGSYSASNVIKGRCYFTLVDDDNSEIIGEVEGGLERITQNSYIVSGTAYDLKPDNDYFYHLWYECKIDGLKLMYSSENYIKFRTLLPKAETIGTEFVGERNASVKCTFINVPEGATCGVQYGIDGSSSIIATSATDGERTIDITGLNSNSTYEYRAFIQYDGRNWYGETKSFTTQAGTIPDLSGIWTFNQAFLAQPTVYPNLQLASSGKSYAKYTAHGFYGIISFSMTVHSDRTATIVLSTPNGASGSFSGTFNEEFTYIGGTSYIYDFGPGNWSIPPEEFNEPWSLSR